jgi:hypothetical protein
VKWGADGKIHQLAKLEGDTVSFAFGINEEGQAVGARGPARTPLCRPMRLRADRTPCCGKRTARSPISARSREVPGTTWRTPSTTEVKSWEQHSCLTAPFTHPVESAERQAGPGPTGRRLCQRRRVLPDDQQPWRGSRLFVSWPSRWRARNCLGRQGPRGPQHADSGWLALVSPIRVVDQRRRGDRGLGNDQW